MSESKCLFLEGCEQLPTPADGGVSRLDITAEDWDALFDAVLQRLRQAVGEVRAMSAAFSGSDPACLNQTIVLECADALAQLHAALKHDRAYTP
jgi:hypothetical protein